MTGMGYLYYNLNERYKDAQDELSNLKSSESSAQYKEQVSELQSKVSDLTEQNSYLTAQVSLLQNASNAAQSQSESEDKTEQTSEGTSETTTEASSQGEKYIVQSGDSLYKIAQKVYGDGSRYTDILKANGMTEDNISLSVGDELIIPE
jgi:nucleoid-associated protein YgaU